MAKVSMLCFGPEMPEGVRQLLALWGVKPVIVKEGDYLDAIRKGEFDAYMLGRFWAEHDYGMPLPSADGITLSGRPRLPTSELPPDRVYLVPKWPSGGPEQAYSSVWDEAAKAAEQYRTVAIPIGQINCVAAPIGMVEFQDEDQARASLEAFFAAIAPLARDRD